MRLLLFSTYELGHQPLHLASPAAALTAEGHEVRMRDISVQEVDDDEIHWADRVAISVPMHTALRLGLGVARRIRALAPSTPIALYGLYASVAADRSLDGLVDAVIAGEYETALVEWAGGGDVDPKRIELGREPHAVPLRIGLPPLSSYARLVEGGSERESGYVEATRGCRHRCRHCPVPTVYDGRLRIVAPEIVAADAAQQVRAGATHLTFGDPDFLNAPAHALRTLEAVRSESPDLTSDVTVKVSHILDHAGLWSELVDLGVLFVVSAFEQADDRILELLDKGHTVDGMGKATSILRDASLAVRPTWLPFTPWTEGRHIGAIVRFIDGHGLWGSVDPIQLSIRLLIPDGSLMLDLPELRQHLGEFDAEALGYAWTPADVGMDVLQAVLSGIIEQGDAEGAADVDVLGRLVAAIEDHTGISLPSVPAVEAAPRLTESWFCCAEPAARQLSVLGEGSDHRRP